MIEPSQKEELIKHYVKESFVTIAKNVAGEGNVENQLEVEANAKAN